MFALNRIKETRMNYSAKYSAPGTSHLMGCRISMMCFMPMIMRRPSSGVMNHIV